MSDSADRIHHWLECMHSNKQLVTGRNVFDHHSEQNQLLSATGSTGVESPARAEAVGDYLSWAKAAETPGTAPISLYDGMQTIVNLARVKAQYDPLDIAPEGKGNLAHFVAFTNNISGCPALTLETSQTTQIEQKSRDAKVLVDSFVAGFMGILDKDRTAIANSVSNLVNAALSYSQKIQRQSNFTQNLLQVQKDPAGLPKVFFNLYCSIFEISVSEHKGTITFYSKYTLAQAVYSMNQTAWDAFKPYFAEQQKVTAEEWLKNMTTPTKAGSQLRAICLVG